MLALQVKEYLQNKKNGATIEEICGQFAIDQFIVQQFLNAWEHAGKIQKISFGNCCNTKSNCSSCIVLKLEIYCWKELN